VKNIFFLFVFLLGTLFSPAQNFEQRILESLSKNRTPGMTHLMQGISNTDYPVSVATPVTLFIIAAAGHNEKSKEKSFIIAGSLLASTVITEGLKYLVNRPRPSTRDSLIIPASDMGSPSFPSGHTSIAFATATSLSMAFPKWYVIAPSFLWAGTVGFSRLYLGVHYPSDVLAGALVGSGSAWLSYKVNEWWRRKQAHKALHVVN
jgi:membrane-associated phospholipid phosphatase